MGVYLSNIEMPRTHPITVEIYPNGTVLSKTVGRMDIHGNAVPVPPHGDLIDRSKIEYIYQMQGGVLMTSNKIIDGLPIIIPAEEVEL